MSDSKHTPLPWKVTVNVCGEHVLHSEVDYACVALISSYKREFNEPFIVRACNAHQSLVDALRVIARMTCGCCGHGDPDWHSKRCWKPTAVNALRAAGEEVPRG